MQKIEVCPSNKGYMHKPEFLRENETYRILWEFEIQKDHLILAKGPDSVIVYKKKREPAESRNLPPRWTTY